MPKLLIATNNHGKMVEFQALLAGLDLELVTPAQAGLILEVEENGRTYAENAAVKAIAFAEASKLVALADDSGLEVEALGGEPGIRSHRFAPQPDASDANRRAYLLERLSSHPRPWKARFFCTVAIAVPDSEAGKSLVRYAEGACPGEVIPEERGENGFGYDPIFLIPELNRTMAELNMEEKNHLSHRARAVLAARPVLAELLGLTL